MANSISCRAMALLKIFLIFYTNLIESFRALCLSALSRIASIVLRTTRWRFQIVAFLLRRAGYLSRPSVCQHFRPSKRRAVNRDQQKRADNYIFHLPESKIGRPLLSTDASGQLHDIIRLSIPARQGIIEKVAEFAANGMSHSWIASELKVTEGWVKRALARQKKIFGSQTKDLSADKKAANRAWHGASPFGFEIIDCRLVENAREIKAIQKIVELWNSGRSMNAVARELNRLKILTRSRRNWEHSVVRSVISRIQQGKFPYNRLALDLRTYTPNTNRSAKIRTSKSNNPSKETST